MAARHLYGYEEQRRSLIQYLSRKSPARIGVLGPEGSGKTSILLASRAQLGSSSVLLDCARVWPATRQGFYLRLLEALDLPRPSAVLEEAPNEFFARLSVPKKAPHVLILDDAHALADIDQALMDEMPVLAARHPGHVVFSGPEAEVAPLCEAIVALDRFSEATSSDFIRSRLQGAGMRVEDQALGVFYEFTRGAPDALQRLGQAAWEEVLARNMSVVRSEHVEAAVASLVDRLPTRMVSRWASVRGLMRDIFVAMCLYDLESPTEIAKRCQQEPKNVIVLLGRLASAHALVERVGRGQYRVRDPLLKHYVRKDWGSPIVR